MYKARKGVRDLPIWAQSLPTVLLADLSAVILAGRFRKKEDPFFDPFFNLSRLTPYNSHSAWRRERAVHYNEGICSDFPLLPPTFQNLTFFLQGQSGALLFYQQEQENHQLIYKGTLHIDGSLHNFFP